MTITANEQIMYIEANKFLMEVVEAERRIDGDEDASQLYFKLMKKKDERKYN